MDLKKLKSRALLSSHFFCLSLIICMLPILARPESLRRIEGSTVRKQATRSQQAQTVVCGCKMLDFGVDFEEGGCEGGSFLSVSLPLRSIAWGSLGIWFEIDSALRVRGSRTCLAPSVEGKQPNCGSILLSFFILLSSKLLSSVFVSERVCVCARVHAQKFESCEWRNGCFYNLKFAVRRAIRARSLQKVVDWVLSRFVLLFSCFL